MKKNCILFVGSTFFSFITMAQHVGIGTTSPANPLHIKSTSEGEILRIEGPTPYISFFNGTTYKGYVWYDGTRMILGTATPEPVVISPYYSISPFYFMPSGRLGLGISNPAEKLDVEGNINLNGVLKVNGSSGTIGQVLTSNGTGDPQWKNAAYGNNIRFSVLLVENGISLSGNAQIGETRYNLSPSDIVIGTSTITVNHAGLYHFDFFIEADVSFTTAPSSFPRFVWALNAGSVPYRFLNHKVMNSSNVGQTNWWVNENGSLQVYITSPTTITVSYDFINSGSSTRSATGILTGNLISD